MSTPGKKRRSNDPESGKPEDDQVPLPALDGESTEEETPNQDFGEQDGLLDEDAQGDLGADLEVGVDDPVELDLDTVADESEEWASDTEDAGELVGGDLGLSEITDESGADGTEHAEVEGLPEESGEPAGDGLAGLEPLPDPSTEGESGVADDQEIHNWLPPLPPLEDAQDLGQGEQEDDGLPEGGDLLEPWMTTLESSAVVTFPDPGYQRLTDVEWSQLALPSALAQGSLQVVCGAVSLFYLDGQLYQLTASQLLPLSADGLSGEPDHLVANDARAASEVVLWAVVGDQAQLSRDGGRSFEAPRPLPIPSVGSAAVTADGTLFVCGQEALYCLPLDGSALARSVDCGVIPKAIQSDGGNALLVVGQQGQVVLSSDGGGRFGPFTGLPKDASELQMCGTTVAALTDRGPWLVQDGGGQPLLVSTARAVRLARHGGKLAVYACVPVEEAWLLVAGDVWERSRRPVVLVELPEAVGQPRQTLVFSRDEQPVVVVAAEHGLIQVKVPFERD